MSNPPRALRAARRLASARAQHDLRARYGGQEAALPSHIVLFAEQVGKVRPFLDERGYRLAHTAFHAHVPADAEYESSGTAEVAVFSKSGKI